MSRDSDASFRKAKRVFRRRKILTLGEVAELIDRSVHTARRRLKQWRAHTSYNHNGRYYTLPEVPEFDANGLWRWRGVSFSQYGNLKQTVIELVRRSPAGLDAGEMRTLLGLEPRSFLSAFADHPQMSRQKAQGRFVYYSAVPSVCAQQQQRRCGLSATARQPTPFEAVAILVEKIKHPALSHEALSRRLRKQQIFVEAQTIENLFVRHDLAVKKNATFDLIGCLSEYLASLLQGGIGAEYDSIRNRLRKHGISAKLRYRAKQLKRQLDRNSQLIPALQTGIDLAAIGTSL